MWRFTFLPKFIVVGQYQLMIMIEKATPEHPSLQPVCLKAVFHWVTSPFVHYRRNKELMTQRREYIGGGAPLYEEAEG